MDFDIRPRRRPTPDRLAELAAVPVAAGVSIDYEPAGDPADDQTYSNIKFGDGDKGDGNVVVGGSPASVPGHPSQPSSYREFAQANNLEPEPPTKNNANKGGSGKTPWFKRPFAWMGAHRKASFAIGVAVLMVIAGGTAFALTRHSKPPVTATVKHAAPKPPPPPPPPTSPLTGAVVSAEDAKRPVTGVMIENTVFARPQSGLKEAGVIYEAIAEAGITRFLALYQEAKPGNIGPVRSARPYYVDWAHTYNAAYAHVGGSPDALAKLTADPSIRNLDQFANSAYFHRISSREAPHNMYTNMEALDQAKAAKGWTSSDFTPWPRKADEKPATPAAITAKSINIAISGPTYNAHYDYIPEDNAYKRSEGGEPHMDAESNTQLEPKVVIALIVPYRLEPDGYHSHYDLEGTGAMTVFQDGKATKGTWQRTGTAMYVFVDEAGHPLKLNTGQTWITAVGSADAVTSAP